MRKTAVRVIIPDSHGAHIDWPAANAFLKDLKTLDPDECVWLGDHLDCGGTFNAHQLNYTKEMPESYHEDCAEGNKFLDKCQRTAPSATHHMLEGNHEAHVERWAARTFRHKKDADMMLDRFGPAEALKLKSRGFRYYYCSEQYMGLSVPGTIKLGKCFFTHGFSFAKNAASVHLARSGNNIVFGHVHRSQSVIERTLTSDGHGAWCPGTLAKLQPLYRHSSPTSWSHGYGLQLIAKSGRFLHINVPIHKGESMLQDVLALAR